MNPIQSGGRQRISHHSVGSARERKINNRKEKYEEFVNGRNLEDSEKKIESIYTRRSGSPTGASCYGVYTRSYAKVLDVSE